MTKGRRGSHYEMVLEDRHLLGVFFAVVLLCALFFTLGFVLGRNQGATQAANSSPPEEAPAEPPAAADDLSFFERVEGKPPPESLSTGSTQPGAKPEETKAAASSTGAAPSASPSSPVHLQVAALTQEDDAKRLADELRKLRFPVVIVSPRDDRFYRVQVGPFETSERAEAAMRRLRAQGFREILVKR